MPTNQMQLPNCKPMFSRTIESLNNQLEDLAVPATSRFEDLELDSIIFCPGFFETCNALIKCLYPCQPRNYSTIEDIFSILSPRPPFELQSDRLQYKILHYLCTMLQLERIRKHRKGGTVRRQRAGDKGKVVFQLDKLCKDLSVIPNTESEETIVNSIIEKSRSILREVPLETIRSPPTLLRSTPSLTQEQLRLLERIRDAIHHDFALRRRMLMTRCDVTIQSFLWAEKALGKEGEIVAAIQSQRSNLSDEPPIFSIQDAIHAPVSLLYEHTKKITDQGGQKSLVKTVIIGAVPDRGGRANEMRPRAADLGFGHAGGRGSGGGGRGGGGGGRGGDRSNSSTANTSNFNRSNGRGEGSGSGFGGNKQGGDFPNKKLKP